jgi:hypothetical protein
MGFFPPCLEDVRKQDRITEVTLFLPVNDSNERRNHGCSARSRKEISAES